MRTSGAPGGGSCWARKSAGLSRRGRAKKKSRTSPRACSTSLPDQNYSRKVQLRGDPATIEAVQNAFVTALNVLIESKTDFSQQLYLQAPLALLFLKADLLPPEMSI